jgi:hypothetical protein
MNMLILYWTSFWREEDFSSPEKLTFINSFSLTVQTAEHGNEPMNLQSRHPQINILVHSNGKVLLALN